MYPNPATRGPGVVTQIFAAAKIAQLGERQTEDLKVPGSIPGLGKVWFCSDQQQHDHRRSFRHTHHTPTIPRCPRVHARVIVMVMVMRCWVDATLLWETVAWTDAVVIGICSVVCE